MEIFQTLWNSLINENVFLLNIVSVPMTFIEATLIFLLFSTILNITYTKKQAILYVTFFSIIALLTTWFVPTPYNTFINIMIYPILVYFILKTNALKSILAEVLVYTLSFIVVAPLIALYTNILNITSAEVSSIPIYKILYSIIFYLILFIIYKIIKKFKFHINFFDKFDTLTYNILIINFTVGTIAIAVQAYTLYLYINYIPKLLMFISLIVLFVYFFISIYSLFRTSQLEKTKQLLSEEKMYNKTLNTLHDNIRGFKHDFFNMVQSIGGYISTNNMEGLKSYYNDLLEDCQISNNLSILNPELINNPAIYSLLADKYYKAENLGIKLNLEVMADLSNLNIKMYELSRILGILLDNAIEAASECETKIINITFRKDKNRNKDLIIIQNSYINKNINIDRIFEKGYSSKQEDKTHQNHGLGLWEIKKYLKKNTNLDLYTTKTPEFFTQQFEIYN